MLRTLPLALALITTPTALAQDVMTPDEHLGRPLGVDFELADWNEVSSYYRLLGEQSPNVITENVGTTTEGRDFLTLTISRPQNLAELEAIRDNCRRIADPRGLSESEKQALIDDGRAVLFVSSAMHSTEAAGAQFSMEFAHRLATSEEEPWKSAREKLVVVVYTTNPDGVDHVTEWYRQTVGTPHEGTNLLKLYQYYSGHDNNRDWFMLTQAETRIVTELLYNKWFPQVYWDVHQQGSRRERFFVPPYRDPLNPNLDPAVITGIDVLGSRALFDMTRQGLQGISTGVSYDMWWNGGNRNVPVRHNIIGLLTEAASVNLASPIFLPKTDLAPPRGLGGYAPSNRFPDPWPGGWWRLRDIIDYEMAFGRSLLSSLTREPQTWLRNSLEAAERSIEDGLAGSPNAWLIPSDNRDPDAVHRLVDVLMQAGVEIHVADGSVEADGRTYPAGTIVIHRGQPYGAHAKDLFDIQRYPQGQPPYDVAGWTLPLLLGVRRVEAMQPVSEVILRKVDDPAEAIASFAGDGRLHDASNEGLLSSHDSDTWSHLFERLQQGESVTLITSGDHRGLFFSGESTDDERDYGIWPIETLPRIGLYAPWSGNMDEGWTRYVLDTWKIPYQTVRNEMLRAGSLHDFLDVLVIPSIGSRQLDQGRPADTIPDRYAGGLAPEGAVAIEEFVRSGGTLITLGSSTRWAIELLELPLVDVTRAPEGEGFSCPGSVLRGIPHEHHPFTAGLPASVALFFSGSSGFREMTKEELEEAERSARGIDILLRYAPTRVLLSGWIDKPQVIEDRMAWVRVPHGDGIVHLFGFRPQYRGWSQSTFPLLFRAMLLDGSEGEG